MKAVTAKVLIFALTIVVAVALLNLAENLQSLGFGDVRYGLPRVGIDPIGPGLGLDPLILAWLLAAAGLAVFVAGFLWIRGWKGRFPFGEFLPLIVGALLFFSILYIVESPGEPTTDEEEAGDTNPEADPQSEAGSNSNNPLTQLLRGDFRFGPGTIGLILAFLAFSAIYLLLAKRRLVGGGGGMEALRRQLELKEEVTGVLGERIYRLELGEDTRSVILGAYRDMVHLFHSYGLRTREFQTAREVEALALDTLGLSGKASADLRRRFEEARYSVHSLTEDHRAAAIESLRRVRRELGA